MNNPQEDKGHACISIRYDQKTYDEIKRLADEDNRSITGYVKHLIFKGMTTNK